MDIVESLRTNQCGENAGCNPPLCVCGMMDDAADEIERLREERNQLRDALFSAFYHFSNSRYQASHDVLRSALKESE